MMRKRNTFAAMLVASLVLSSLAASAGVATVMENFPDDPVAAGRATVEYGPIGGSAPAGAPNTYVWNAPGDLTHNLNTNWRLAGGSLDTSNYVADSSRLAWSLPRTYTQADSFSFGATLTINSLAAWSEQYMQIAFGLVNSATTILDRTGHPDPSTGWSTGGNCFDSFEWNFFPNESSFGWPTLQQTVVGSDLFGPDAAFWHMAANFNLADAQDGGYDTLLAQEIADSTHPLFGNPYGLPLGTPMAVTMDYDGPTTTVSMLITDAGTGAVLVDNIVTLPDLNISAPIGGFGSVSSFAIDTLAIMDPQDGNAWGDDPSIVADITYENIWFNETADAPVTEPGVLSLLALGAAGLLRRRKHRTSC